jgi:hypothetical protein
MNLFDAITFARAAMHTSGTIVLDTRARKMVAKVSDDLNSRMIAEAYNKLAEFHKELRA